MGCVRFSGCNWESNGPIREERKIQGVLTLNLSRAPTPAKTLGKVDAVQQHAGKYECMQEFSFDSQHTDAVTTLEFGRNLLGWSNFIFSRVESLNINTNRCQKKSYKRNTACVRYLLLQNEAGLDDLSVEGQTAPIWWTSAPYFIITDGYFL